jgi:transposase
MPDVRFNSDAKSTHVCAHKYHILLQPSNPGAGRDESARYKPRPRRATKLDPFKDYVVERLTSAAPERIPAKQMQVDWAVIRCGSNRLLVFVATLGWSRASYVEFASDERVETLIQAHEDAFLAFRGTPREVLYDNMRTVVLQRHGYGRGRHRFHPGFLDFVRHCGFQPRLCAPYRAQTEGKVERFIRYLRESFWVPLSQPTGPGRSDRRP